MSDEDAYRVAMNFSWLDGGMIAGCRGPRTDADLAFLVSVGIRALVRLASEEETGLCGTDVEAHGIQDCYEPVKDFTLPLQTQIDRVVSFMNAAITSGRPVAVSCGAGCGRTGTLLGCFLIYKGLSPEAAIRRLLDVRPCSGEINRVPPGQRDAIIEYGRRRAARTDGDVA